MDQSTKPLLFENLKPGDMFRFVGGQSYFIKLNEQLAGIYLKPNKPPIVCKPDDKVAL